MYARVEIRRGELKLVARSYVRKTTDNAAACSLFNQTVVSLRLHNLPWRVGTIPTMLDYVLVFLFEAWIMF